VRYIARVHGNVHAGVAELHTGADDADTRHQAR
jgi:hypothetical protein